MEANLKACEVSHEGLRADDRRSCVDVRMDTNQKQSVQACLEAHLARKTTRVEAILKACKATHADVDPSSSMDAPASVSAQIFAAMLGHQCVPLLPVF